MSHLSKGQKVAGLFRNHVCGRRTEHRVRYDTKLGYHPDSVLKFNVVVGEAVAIDFETYYDSNAKYSLRNLPPYDYVHHECFDPYMVSIVSEKGEEFIGDPRKFDWSSLKGAKLLAHNASFDAMVVNRMVELGLLPESILKNEWYCTADLAAFLSVPRNLKDAVFYLLGTKISKKIRASMDGKTLADAIGCGIYDDLLDYAGDDARYCMKLWLKYRDQWSLLERDISKYNKDACWRGIRIDRKELEAGLQKLREVKSNAESSLPWTSPERDQDYKPPGSIPALAAHARGLGLEVPSTFNKQSVEMQQWVEKYKDQYAFIQARLDVASVASHLKRLESMDALMDGEDVMRFGIKYFGAHTGRASAGDSSGDSEKRQTAKFNILNIVKNPKSSFGVDMRGMLIPRPGRVFVIFDFSQIEPRLTHWVAGNDPFLKLIRKEDPYQANAKVLGWYPMDKFDLKNDDPDLRQVSKMSVIGLGYGMGAAKFLAQCRQKGVVLPSVSKDGWDFRSWDLTALAKMDLSVDNPDHEQAICEFMGSISVVRQWRAANKPVADFWTKVNMELKMAAARQEAVHNFILPSGRTKPFFKPRQEPRYKLEINPETGELETTVERRLFASVVQGRKRSTFHGGIITENIIQALARDVMYTGAVDVCRMEPNWWFDFAPYDEVVFEVPEDEAEDALKVIPECLCNGSIREWIGDLPLAVEGGIRHKYGNH